jgi:hypothetical protein
MAEKKGGDSGKVGRDSKKGKYVPLKDSEKFVRKTDDKPGDTQSTGPKKEKK